MIVTITVATMMMLFVPPPAAGWPPGAGACPPPDGMLAPPFGKNDPWDMKLMVENWDRIANDPRPEAQAFRTAVETFLRAMRLAQPLRMPPNAQGYPKVMELNFRIGDL